MDVRLPSRHEAPTRGVGWERIRTGLERTSMSDAEHLPLPEPLYRGIDEAGHTYAAGAGGPVIPVRGMSETLIMK
jgi:hypothetical protein